MEIKKVRHFTVENSRALPVFLILTIYLIQLRSFGTHNMSYYILWAKSIVEGNLFEIYHATSPSLLQNSDSLTVPYTPLSQYLIAGISWVLLHFLSDSRGTYVLSVNLTCVLFTFFTALIFQKNRKIFNLKPPVLYLMTPAVILSSPILGYEDSIMSFFLVAALISLKKERHFLAGLLSGSAIFSKQLAIMPIFAIFFILLCAGKIIPLMRATAGVIISSTFILAPFVASGNLIYYFKAQGLTSIHTMASAQGANFPWLASLGYRMMSLGAYEGVAAGGNGLRIPNDTLRQFFYLGSGVFTITIFLVWVFYWRKRGSVENFNYSLAASVMIFSYHLFNFGVHENHIYMILPVLYLASAKAEIWKIYKQVAFTLSIIFLSAYGFGAGSLIPGGLAGSNPSLFTLIMGVCFMSYLISFIQIIKTNPDSQNEKCWK